MSPGQFPKQQIHATDLCSRPTKVHNTDNDAITYNAYRIEL